MIDPKAIISYAQYNEDLILLALLHDVKKGFYVDVGANYAVTDSVTKLFYDKDWAGINIEPIKSLHQQLEIERPRDTNLQCGIGDKAGETSFREYLGASGHSTFSVQQKNIETDKKYKDYKVPIKTLSQIFSENTVKDIHFLKIDVEGYEYEVVAGNDWSKYRPEIVCIEANHQIRDWRPILKKNRYQFFVADGLNEYYIADSAWHRTENFAERIVKLDYHALKFHQWQSWSSDSSDLKILDGTVKQQTEIIRAKEQEIAHLQKLVPMSLKNQPLRRRLQIAATGLTVDWIRFKKGKS